MTVKQKLIQLVKRKKRILRLNPEIKRISSLLEMEKKLNLPVIELWMKETDV